jgi:hypothetical protein
VATTRPPGAATIAASSPGPSSTPAPTPVDVRRRAVIRAMIPNSPSSPTVMTHLQCRHGTVTA